MSDQDWPTEKGVRTPLRAERLRQLLVEALAPELLEVTDESHRHAGHAGARAGGETHYAVTIVSRQFAGLGRVERSRLVHARLKGEFDAGLHALTLNLQAPGER